MQAKLLSYIAGFLDGDGCIMAQLVRRKDYKYGYQIRLSIVFYQKEQHIKFLEWLKAKLRCGYIRKRNDKMAEYAIVGKKCVQEILEELLPYLQLKRDLAKLVLEIAKMPDKPTAKEFLKYARMVDFSSKYTYSKKRTKTKAVVEEYFKKHEILPP